MGDFDYEIPREEAAAGDAVETDETNKLQSIHLNYIRTTLRDKFFEKMPNESSLLDESIESRTGLSGFMSAVYDFTFSTKNIVTGKVTKHSLFIKFMKGNENFRKSVRAYTQFANEIFAYDKIIPYYKEVIKGSPRCKIDVDKWIPTTYFAEYGNIAGLNTCFDSTIKTSLSGKSSEPPISKESYESCLVLENMLPHGFRGGPRLHLDKQHLKLMTKLIAEYHSITYASRIRGDEEFENLVGGIIPLPFITEEDVNVYKSIYDPAFLRFFQYVDRVGSECDPDFFQALNKFKNLYGDKPLELLERFREIDETFSVILHGDYNRNNVLFHYDKKEGFENPTDIRMIDFQEMRYGSPALDLAFFMYMNIHPSIREEIWMELLKYYHVTLITSICDILGFEFPVEHDSLKKYSFENFYEHFRKFAFYGAVVCFQFLPWMECSEKECAYLSYYFEKDMFSEKFSHALQNVGGDRANKLVLDVVHHSWQQGYMDAILNEGNLFL
ncbi:unnamed protein product [Hermetia illucens]|uniref:CHK kinase-like domain-containing protein n=1 Tax=Hermetia illucens TaxID=343691 RepID=A0A7R8UD04_HERIL|nr:uncharacterized protein LOC119658328 [Hermetia illucens]XP_037921604.1 uncharacterized protein LOC119658328 [Hermetia illucens]XP_037921614.1 uncharacterized protein LOC119658328 [Hermetia illucens]XP_037921620.1 uncharacterized protein LOC119658328 [Hermetia illucens]CAD7077692.1 unnamed protein product [Hermetia illucens]